MRVMLGAVLLVALVAAVPSALGDTLQYFLNDPGAGITNEWVQPIDISPADPSTWYNYIPSFGGGEFGGNQDIDGNGSNDLGNKQLTMGLIRNGPSGEVHLFCIYGDPANDGWAPTRMYDLTIANVPSITDSSFVVEDESAGSGSDGHTFYANWGAYTDLVRIRNSFDDNETDGFVLKDFYPATIPGIVHFDLDDVQNPCTPQLQVVWLRANGNPLVLDWSDNNCNVDIDWQLNVTPEPASAAILLVGLGVLGLRFRRKKKA